MNISIGSTLEKKLNLSSLNDFFRGYFRPLKQFLLFGLCSFFLSSLSGCASPDLYQNASFNPPVYFGFHLVGSGDTLYSIAWRYGRDYKELAAANDIHPPYMIRKGQKIRLDLTASIVKKVAVIKKKKGTKKRSKKAAKQASKVKKVSKKLTRKPVKYDRLLHKKSVSKIRNVGGVRWQWPHVGKVIAGYTVTLAKKANSRNRRKIVNKGIDIKGKMGDSIYASSDGEVVYAGRGLRGYGKLIILNHNEQYLSAYAHNKKRDVKEGQKIKAGDIIADMGKTGARQVMLHFEIRKDGNPVDPVRYLPKK